MSCATLSGQQALEDSQLPHLLRNNISSDDLVWVAHARKGGCIMAVEGLTRTVLLADSKFTMRNIYGSLPIIGCFENFVDFDGMSPMDAAARHRSNAG